MFWLPALSGYTAWLNSFLDVLILAQKQGQDSQLVYGFPHAENNSNRETWSWKKEGSCQSQSMPTVLLEHILRWVLFHQSLDEATEYEDLSQCSEQIYSVEQCCCAMISSKCQLLQCLLKRKKKKWNNVTFTQKLFRFFHLNSLVSRSCKKKKSFLINGRKQIVLKDVVHESRINQSSFPKIR